MGHGLEFVYIGVGIFETSTGKRIRRKHGGAGLAVFIRLLLEIAKNGYFLPWDEDTPLDLAEDWREDKIEMIKGVVDDCLNTGFYNREIFDAFHILTGEQIQENFKQANSHRQKPLRLDARYWLISRDGMPACITFSDGKQGRTIPNTRKKQTAPKPKQEPKPPSVTTNEQPKEAPPESTEWGDDGYMSDM